MKPDPFPWDDVMRLMLGRLHWTPQTFWAATPQEVARAIEGFQGKAPTIIAPDRAMIDRLSSLFPDETKS